MKSTKPTKKSKQTQIEVLKLNKKWMMSIIVILLICISYFVINYVVPTEITKSGGTKEIILNLTSNSTDYEVVHSCCTSSSHYLWSKGFFDSLFSNHDFSILRKILIFFGIVYFAQLAIIGVFEALEIVFLFYALVRRGIKRFRKKKEISTPM